ncbi:prealbumin-like fold domain-containing protein [Bifidobacterium amazonense]|uniref:Prealbumin-like fold domain-containing protein n=2 Tax=Bifidobacterium amazonense TaxID=2809027 RepID=A0ABS9VVN2_9BIFI|nr:SpaA isopeptide-forming pilin-related protein [Bifidobacterium amazonense]MCH9276158.1 prealbumin-like fold domain-containing protein [Bifidobacterium amazonense]
MQDAGCNADYLIATIPQVTKGGFLFYNGDTKAYYKLNGKDNFAFNESASITVANGGQSNGAPSGCPATTASATSAAALVQSDSVESDSVTSDSTESDASELSLADGVTETNAESDDASDSAVTALDVQSDEIGVSLAADESQSKTASCIATDGTAGHPGTKCDIDTKAGQFKVNGLATGTYLLKETAAPDGYTINKTVYVFEITTGGTVAWKGGYEDGNTSGTLDNTLKPDLTHGNAISDKSTEMKWYKVSSEDPNAANGYLKGAQWQLVRVKDGANKDIATADQTTYCVVDGNGDGKSDSGGNLICPKTDTAGATITRLTDVSNTETTGTTITVKNEADGIIKITGLTFGTYEMTETVAPEGYDLSTATYTFTIDQTSTSDKTVEIKMTPAEGSAGTPVTGNRITNRPGAELPDTGGEGTKVFLCSGVIAVLVATLGLSLMARRCRS